MSAYSVKKPYTIFMAVIMILVLGFVSFSNMTIDLFPKMELPYVVVMTSYPGASPEKIELSVTKPIEQALSTASGIKKTSSVSEENVSMVILEFEGSTNMDSAVIELNGSLDLIRGQFEDGVSSPIIMKMNPAMMPLMVASIDMAGQDIRALSSLTEKEIIPELERIDGLAAVKSNGLSVPRYVITLNQAKIDNFNEKLISSVDQQLAEAQSGLQDAKNQLAQGKEELKKQQETAKNEIASGSVKLQSVSATLHALLSEESTLQAQQKAFMAEKSAYESAQQGENAVNQTLAAAKAAAAKGIESQKNQFIQTVNEKLTALNGSIPDLPTSITTYEEALAVAPALGLEAPVFPDLNMFPSTIEEFLALSPQQRQAYETVIGQALSDLSPEELQKIKDTLSVAAVRTQEIETELRNIDTRLATISAMKPQLQTALDEAQKGQLALEEGTLSYIDGISLAQAQLTQSELALTEAEEEFTRQRDTALEQADLGGIITKEYLRNLLAAQNFSMPAGSVIEGEDHYTVKIGDQIKTEEALRQLPILSMDVDGLRNITLEDIADIQFQDDTEGSYAKINGNNGLLLAFQKQSTASTAEVSKSIRSTAKLLEEKYEGMHITPLMDQGVYIQIVIQSVLHNLMMGAILAVLILLLFLKNIKTTAIVGVSIPISVMFAVVMMYFSGVTLNIVSLSGLALGIGMLVDNSIVVIENIYRLRLMGKSNIASAIEGAKQVAGAIFASTLTTVCVFLPIVFTEGMTRQLFTDMGLTIAYSLIASLIVALTLVPAMSRGMLKVIQEKPHPLFDRLTTLYERLLRWSLRHRAIVLLTAAILFIGSLCSLAVMGTAFMPESDSKQISILAEMPKGTKKAEAYALTDTLTQRLESIEDVETVGATLGQSTMMGGDENTASFYLLLREDKKKSAKEISTEIRTLTDDLPCTLNISTSNMDMSMLGGKGIELSIKGRDLDTLRSISSDLTALLQNVEGIQSIDNGLEDAAPQIYIEVNKEKAISYGLTVAQVYQQVAAALAQDATATTLPFSEEDYAVMITNPERNSYTRNTLKNMVLTPGASVSPEENEVLHLSDIASLKEQPSFASIHHENQIRTLSVTAELKEDYNIGLVSRSVENKLTDYDVPAGYTVALEGENATINESLSQLLLMLLLAVSMIYMIMAAQFQSLKSPFIVMFTIPLAFTGGIYALLLTVHEVSVLSMLGFLILAGVVVNNGIVFVDYTNQLRLQGIEKEQALIQTGHDRIRPVLMTALTTILGLLTMAMGIGDGSDMMQPMAIVVIGGLLYATVLTLFVVPCLYSVMHKKSISHIE